MRIFCKYNMELDTFLKDVIEYTLDIFGGNLHLKPYKR